MPKIIQQIQGLLPLGMAATRIDSCVVDDDVGSVLRSGDVFRVSM